MRRRKGRDPDKQKWRGTSKRRHYSMDWAELLRQAGLEEPPGRQTLVDAIKAEREQKGKMES